MGVDANWFIFLVLALVLLKPFMEFCRRSAFWGRPKLPEDKVLCLFGGGERTRTALHFLAKVYDVPLGFLRPGDVFTDKGPLWKYDSWSLSAGQEKLDDYLREHGKIDVPQTWTLLDFVLWHHELGDDLEC